MTIDFLLQFRYLMHQRWWHNVLTFVCAPQIKFFFHSVEMGSPLWLEFKCSGTASFVQTEGQEEDTELFTYYNSLHLQLNKWKTILSRIELWAEALNSSSTFVLTLDFHSWIYHEGELTRTHGNHLNHLRIKHQMNQEFIFESYIFDRDALSLQPENKR